jgi:hypothetical protein
MAKGAGDRDKEDPPEGGKYVKRAKKKEEGLASAKEVCYVAIKVDDGNATFLLMAEATVAIVTALSSTVELGAVFVVGSGDDDDHPGIVIAAMMRPMKTMMTTWLGSWWGTDDRNNIAAPIIKGGNF